MNRARLSCRRNKKIFTLTVYIYVFSFFIWVLNPVHLYILHICIMTSGGGTPAPRFGDGPWCFLRAWLRSPDTAEKVRPSNGSRLTRKWQVEIHSKSTRNGGFNRKITYKWVPNSSGCDIVFDVAWPENHGWARFASDLRSLFNAFSFWTRLDENSCVFQPEKQPKLPEFLNVFPCLPHVFPSLTTHEISKTWSFWSRCFSTAWDDKKAPWLQQGVRLHVKNETYIW